jgi:hypothetical protein
MMDVMKIALQQIPVKNTTVLAGHVVTRWTEHRFEIGTWGHAERMLDLECATAVLEGRVQDGPVEIV